MFKCLARNEGAHSLSSPRAKEDAIAREPTGVDQGGELAISPENRKAVRGNGPESRPVLDDASRTKARDERGRGYTQLFSSSSGRMRVKSGVLAGGSRTFQQSCEELRIPVPRGDGAHCRRQAVE